MEMLIGQLIGQVIGAVLGALLGALLIQLGCKWVADFKPSYGMAYKAALLGILAPMGVGFVIGLVIGFSGGQMTPRLQIGLAILGFILQAAIYGYLLVEDTGERLGFGRGILVSLIQLAIAAAMIFAIVLIVLMVSPENIPTESVAGARPLPAPLPA